MNLLQRLDESVFKWCGSHDNEWAAYLFRDVTSFASPTGTALVLATASAVMILLGQQRLCVISVGTFLASTAIVTVLKLAINRPRPLPYDPDVHGLTMDLTRLVVPHYPSFPSGHTTAAVVLYGTLGSTTAIAFPSLATFLIIFSVGFPILIGMSRVYIRAHWLTDTVAGYGLGWLIIGVRHFTT